MMGYVIFFVLAERLRCGVVFLRRGVGFDLGLGWRFC